MHTFSSPKLPSRSPKLPNRSPKLPKRSASQIKRAESSASASRSEIDLDSSADEQERPATPSRHKKSDSGGTAKIPSRPSSRSSRHRTSSTATLEENSVRKNVSGWMDSVRGKKSKFTSLQDDEDAASPSPDKESSRSITNAFGSLMRKDSTTKKESMPIVEKDRLISPPSLQERKVVRAIYDFNGSSDELSFKVGDEIMVVNEVLDDWWMGSLNGKQGLFPTPYTETVASKTKKAVVLKRTRTGKALEEDVYSAPQDSDEDSPDDGYRTSDLDEEDAYKSRPLAPSHSPFFGGPPDLSNIGSDNHGQDLLPSISRHGASAASAARPVPPPPMRRASTSTLR